MNWRGEFSLATTYWLFGFFGNIFVGILAVLIASSFRSESGYQPQEIFLSLLVTWAGVVSVAVWQTVGVWRSANRHIKQQRALGRKAPWAGLAKIAVSLGMLRLAGTFLSSGGPQLLEASRMSFLDDPDIPAYSIRVMRNGTEAEISGGFKYGLTDDFVKISNASRQIKVLHLDSIGGRVGEAEKLNKIIRSKNLDTYVSSRCLSACTVAFAAGAHRILRDGAVLGFHAPAFPGISKEELLEAVQSQKDIFIAAGFDKKFVEQALSTPNSELWRPNSTLLLQAKVITAISDGTDYAMSGFGKSLTKDDFGKILMRNVPLMGPLKNRFPSDYDTLVQTYYESFESGKTQAESEAAGRGQLLVIMTKLKPLADDDVLADMSALYADQYDALGSKSPELCYQYASGVGNTVTPSDIPDTLTKRENEINRRIVETASTRSPAYVGATGDIWKKLEVILSSKALTTDQINLLFADTVPASKYGDYCVVATTLFKEISKLPPPEAGAVMRDVLAHM